jgi:hypothetical protein
MKKSQHRNKARRDLKRARAASAGTIHEGNGRAAYRVEGGQIVHWYHTGVMRRVREDMRARMEAGMMPSFEIPGWSKYAPP